MRIEVFILTWNEQKLIPYVISHYQKFCDKITILDNYSNDKTPEIARANGCHVENFGKPGVLDDEEYLNVKNHCWKGSDADYVIVCDCDEVLYFPHLRDELLMAHEKGVNFFETEGWNIFSVKPESRVHSITDILTGVPDKGYSKPVIFSPRALYEINYRPGAHVCDPIFREPKKITSFKPFLLHYRSWRTFQELSDRHRQYSKRMSKKNRLRGWGIHYLWSDSKRRKEYDLGFLLAKDLHETELFKNSKSIIPII